MTKPSEALGLPAAMQDLEEAAQVFQALGDPGRLRMLLYLQDHSELCVCDLAELSGDAVATVSQRLKVLKVAKLVRGRRSGKHIYYSLADEHAERLVANGLEHVRLCLGHVHA